MSDKLLRNKVYQKNFLLCILSEHRKDLDAEIKTTQNALRIVEHNGELMRTICEFAQENCRHDELQAAANRRLAGRVYHVVNVCYISFIRQLNKFIGISYEHLMECINEPCMNHV